MAFQESKTSKIWFQNIFPNSREKIHQHLSLLYKHVIKRSACLTVPIYIDFSPHLLSDSTWTKGDKSQLAVFLLNHKGEKKEQ